MSFTPICIPFSPLLIEEGTATHDRSQRPKCTTDLSVLYLSRKALQHKHTTNSTHTACLFQSSTYRGRHCNGTSMVRRAGPVRTFSPLLIEEGTATVASKGGGLVGTKLSVLYLSRKALQPGPWSALAPGPRGFQSSTYRGRHCNSLSPGADHAPNPAFSPLLIEEGTATVVANEPVGLPIGLSVLYLSRKGLQPSGRCG